MNITAGFILAAFPLDYDGLAEAKQYIAEQGFTQEDVKLIKSTGYHVVAKRMPESWRRR